MEEVKGTTLNAACTEISHGTDTFKWYIFTSLSALSYTV
jgi:hypothetical protein